VISRSRDLGGEGKAFAGLLEHKVARPLAELGETLVNVLTDSGRVDHRELHRKSVLVVLSKVGMLVVRGLVGDAILIVDDRPTGRESTIPARLLSRASTTGSNSTLIRVDKLL